MRRKKKTTINLRKEGDYTNAITLVVRMKLRRKVVYQFILVEYTLRSQTTLSTAKLF
jgi:hypothetical protein